MMKLISAKKFKWSNGFGVANCSDLEMGPYQTPRHLMIHSPKTNKTLKFSLDQEEAESAECWDGEFVILRTSDKKFAVQIWNY